MGATNYNHPIKLSKLVTFGTAVCRIGHADLTTAGTSQVLTLSDLNTGKGESAIPANSKIVNCWINLLEVFAGGTVSACTVKLGDAGSDNELITNVSVFTGAALGIKPMTGSYSAKFEAGYVPIATFTSTTDNVVNLSTGLLEVIIQYETISTGSVTS